MDAARGQHNSVDTIIKYVEIHMNREDSLELAWRSLRNRRFLMLNEPFNQLIRWYGRARLVPQASVPKSFPYLYQPVHVHSYMDRFTSHTASCLVRFVASFPNTVLSCIR